MSKTKSSAEHVEELSAILHSKPCLGSPTHDEDEKDEDDDTGGMANSWNEPTS
jgi:hypothetical protein